MSEITIREITAYTHDIVKAFGHIVPQLQSSGYVPNENALKRMIENSGIRLLVADGNDGAILGTLCLAVFETPSGVKAHIEDVIVDESARGKGIASAMIIRAIDLAQEAGARVVDLTSRPSRTAANSLYKKMGFEVRETNAYRYHIGRNSKK